MSGALLDQPQAWGGSLFGDTPPPQGPGGDWRDTVAPEPSQAQAWDVNSKEYRDWLERDRQRQIALGNVDPETGQMTDQGRAAQRDAVMGGFGPGNVGGGGGFVGAIDAWHGSPYKFSRFDFSKIGTGEGNQLFGHGGYIAEARALGEHYRDTLSRQHGLTGDVTIDGVPVPRDQATRGQLLAGGALKWKDPDSVLAQLKPTDFTPGPAIEEARQLLSQGRVGRAQPGALYHVQFDADHPQLLDWDKPLSAQSPEVLANLEKTGWMDKARQYFQDNRKLFPNPTGEDFHDYLTHGPPKVAAKAVAQRLDRAGVPGIRYLDASSRPEGRGTSNIVALNDRRLQILRMLGLAGTTATGAGAAMPSLFGDDPEQGGLM